MRVKVCVSTVSRPSIALRPARKPSSRLASASLLNLSASKAMMSFRSLQSPHTTRCTLLKPSMAFIFGKYSSIKLWPALRDALSLSGDHLQRHSRAIVSKMTLSVIAGYVVSIVVQRQPWKHDREKKSEKGLVTGFSYINATASLKTLSIESLLTHSMAECLRSNVPWLLEKWRLRYNRWTAVEIASRLLPQHSELGDIWYFARWHLKISICRV